MDASGVAQLRGSRESRNPEEERELSELLGRNGRMDDVKRFVAANSDRFRMERVRR